MKLSVFISFALKLSSGQCLKVVNNMTISILQNFNIWQSFNLESFQLFKVFENWERQIPEKLREFHFRQKLIHYCTHMEPSGDSSGESTILILLSLTHFFSAHNRLRWSKLAWERPFYQNAIPQYIWFRECFYFPMLSIIIPSKVSRVWAMQHKDNYLVVRYAFRVFSVAKQRSKNVCSK